MFQNYEWNPVQPVTFNYNMKNCPWAPTVTYPSMIVKRAAPSILSPANGYSLLPPNQTEKDVRYYSGKRSGYDMPVFVSNIYGGVGFKTPEEQGLDAPDQPNQITSPTYFGVKLNMVPPPLEVYPPEKGWVCNKEDGESTEKSTSPKNPKSSSSKSKSAMMILFILCIVFFLATFALK